MSRTLMSRPIGRESLSPHPTLYTETETKMYTDTDTDSETKKMVGAAATVSAPPPNSEGEPLKNKTPFPMEEPA